MFKNLVIKCIGISFFFITLFANKLEVTANSLKTTQDTVYAENGVVVYYDNTIIKAKQAKYNKKTKLLILDEEVEMIGYEGTKEYTNHLELQTDSKRQHLKSYF